MGLPPVEPPDLRNRRRRNDDEDDDGDYPPRNYNQPARRGGQPPADDRGYPPQDSDYPPRDARRSSGGDLGPVNTPDLRRSRGRGPTNQGGGLDSYNSDDYRRPGDRGRPLDEPDVPDLRRRRSREREFSIDDDAPPRSRRGAEAPPERRRPPAQPAGPPPGGFLQEHQIEALAAGFTLLMLGIGIILLIVSDGTFLFRIFPLLGGGTLLAGGVFQKVVKGWHVSIITWGFAVLLLATGITSIANSGGDIVTGGILFCGTLVIMSAVVMILQIFRR